MPKGLLYTLLAVVDFVAAYYFYHSGRVVVPAILAIAGVCFVMAAIGAARKTDA
ncbi:MAG TPA: hypothetical protein VJ982_04810 [Gemmatimonadota bacterium]|nr:hypothetical protein [Gemmatimonadota bacterium]